MDLEEIYEAERTMQAFDKVMSRARAHTIEDVQGEILKRVHREEQKLGMHTLSFDMTSNSNDSENPLLLNDSQDATLDSLSGLSTSTSVDTLNIRWEFRKILSYWSIVFYIIGCLMFSFGCVFAMAMDSNVEEIDLSQRTKALVQYPFYVGSTCFFIGSYIGWFRVINKKYNGKGVIFFGYVNSRTYIKASLYTAGGVFYVAQNYNKIIQNGIDPGTGYDLQVTLFLSIASGLQMIAGTIDLNLNRVLECNFHDFYFWACWGNLLGCFFFLVGSWAAWFTDKANWINVPYLVGSFFFAGASWIYLWVWKREQWVFYFPFSEDVRVNIWQQIQLMFYLISVSLSICVFVFYAARHDKFDYFYCMVAAFSFFFNMGLLQLANAMVTAPEETSWKFMFIFMRLLALLMFLIMVVATVNVYDECVWDTNAECN